MKSPSVGIVIEVNDVHALVWGETFEKPNITTLPEPKTDDNSTSAPTASPYRPKVELSYPYNTKVSLILNKFELDKIPIFVNVPIPKNWDNLALKAGKMVPEELGVFQLIGENNEESFKFKIEEEMIELIEKSTYMNKIKCYVCNFSTRLENDLKKATENLNFKVKFLEPSVNDTSKISQNLNPTRTALKDGPELLLSITVEDEVNNNSYDEDKEEDSDEYDDSDDNIG
jgi:hypothetical protein